MISFTEFFEAITFFGEIVIGQIGFQKSLPSTNERTCRGVYMVDSLVFTPLF